jgi:hypothetical protein
VSQSERKKPLGRNRRAEEDNIKKDTKKWLVTVEWRRLHRKELYALYSSPNIIQVNKSRRLR